SDKKGNSIEAEFVNIFSDQVVLRKPDGNQIKVPKSGLSQKDIMYLEYAIPPDIDLEVNIDRDKKTISSYSSDYGDYDHATKTERIRGKATIVKKSRHPCKRDFTAYLYVFGKRMDTDDVMVIDRTEHGFSFENQKETEFSGDLVSVTYTKSSYSSSHGTEYEGYLLFVDDDDGKVVATKGSRELYEDNVDEVRDARINSRFDRDFKLLNRPKKGGSGPKKKKKKKKK
ncbi:MAG: hypothetical protein K9M45_07300, partial [Kiritimatiellales bacterium]|nr:hypothetical protein [Kiritimatiellales bacterium]